MCEGTNLGTAVHFSTNNARPTRLACVDRWIDTQTSSNAKARVSSGGASIGSTWDIYRKKGGHFPQYATATDRGPKVSRRREREREPRNAYCLKATEQNIEHLAQRKPACCLVKIAVSSRSHSRSGEKQSSLRFKRGFRSKNKWSVRRQTMQSSAIEETR